MATHLPEPLQQAAGFLRANQLTEARALLVRVLRDHPESDQAWYLLSLAVTEPDKQVDCLQRALRLNPNYNAARERLAELQSISGAPLASLPSVTTASLLPALRASRPMTAPLQEPKPASPPAAPVKPATPAKRQPDPPTPQDHVQNWRSQLANTSPSADAGTSPTAAARRSLPGPMVGLIALLVVAIVGLGGAGIYVLRLYTAPPTSPFVVVAVTPVRFPTLPPVWTATPLPSPTAIPSVTPLPTPTPSATFPPPDSTQAAQMDKIEQQVADLRGLKLEGSPARFLIPRQSVEEVLRGQLVVPALVAQLENEKLTWSALGLIKPTYDLVRYALNSSSDALGGFYLPWNKQMYVIGDHFSGIERFIYSHEFDHALTDKHFHIDAMGVYPSCASNAQRCAAIRALVEGDATLLMGQWWRQYATPKDYQDIANYRPPSQTLPEEFSPPFAAPDLNFPYQQGLDFVTTLYRRGNWAAVNKAYGDLPASTEQILHPDKYFAHEAPITVTDAALTDTLGSGWRLAGDDVLGEWTTYLILGYGADFSADLSDATAQAAARGWGGDHYQAYTNDSTQATVLAAHWVWDTAADAREFAAAMRQYQDLRFRGAKVDRPDGACWEANGQISCTFNATNGNETLWLLAPNQTVLNQVLAAYPNFP